MQGRARGRKGERKTHHITSYHHITMEFGGYLLNVAKTPTRARARKGEAQGVLSYQKVTGIFDNPHMKLWTISTLQPQHGAPQKQDAELFLLILSTGNMDLLVDMEMIQVYQGNFGIESRTLKANKNPTTENVRELTLPFVFLFSVIQVTPPWCIGSNSSGTTGNIWKTSCN